MVTFATATAVANYHVGYVASNFAEVLGIIPTVEMKKYLENKKVMDSPYRRKMRNTRTPERLGVCCRNLLTLQLHLYNPDT